MPTIESSGVQGTAKQELPVQSLPSGGSLAIWMELRFGTRSEVARLKLYSSSSTSNAIPSALLIGCHAAVLVTLHFLMSVNLHTSNL